jgi:microcystin-dependent protein
MADEGSTRAYDPVKDASAQEPLTANEVKLVTRLFGDPFAFPLEFKAWLRGWLEEQFPRIGTLAVSAASGAAGAFVPPAGSILDFGGDVAPGGYVLCDGAAYDKTALPYQALWAVIGNKYGSPGGNLFNVPDFRGRLAVGKGTNADVDTLGDNDGAALASRGPRHRHLIHVQSNTQGLVNGSVFYTMWPTDDPQPNRSTTPTGSGMTDTPAFLVVNKIISLGS